MNREKMMKILAGAGISLLATTAASASALPSNQQDVANVSASQTVSKAHIQLLNESLDNHHIHPLDFNGGCNNSSNGSCGH